MTVGKLLSVVVSSADVHPCANYVDYDIVRLKYLLFA
jgi:hypothetical protein